MEKLEKALESVKSKVDTNNYLEIPTSKWKDILVKECNVYALGQEYIAKRFNQINFEYCSVDDAKDILIDNVYALLRYKYFTKETEETADKIEEIVKAIQTNIKTILINVTYSKDSDGLLIQDIPNYCCAFKNGVYDFMNNKWLFKYDVYEMKKVHNRIYTYDNKYTIMWYLDYDFEPLPICIMDYNLEKFISAIKDFDKEVSKNFCFELFYNMCHNENDKFELKKAEHLSQYIGFLLYRQFSQHIAFMLGTGGNGKNSLFDGCFTSRCMPRPSNIDMETIEEDKFVTGALENHYQNIFLETEAKSYSKTRMIKDITGSMYQTIEPKGVNKYQGLINCKFMFAGNDQDQIKFKDTTQGFLRRINMFEIFYKWDAKKEFLSKGDYYDTSFSDDLHEIKDDNLNTTMFVYLGMYGILLATKRFTANFKFTYNDWKQQYSDVDFDLKSVMEDISMSDVVRFLKLNSKNADSYFYDENGETKLYKSNSFKESHADLSLSEMLRMFKDANDYNYFFSEHDCYVKLEMLHDIVNSPISTTKFTQAIKKLYTKATFKQLNNNRPYIKVTFRNDKLKIIE